ncbi:hypothetical protein M3Y98_01205500 [Aphelenchoides besseyi]|nr:hypothetical protein M3Y98_01205500 [Aphelenchoides besseyi]KAI6193265.1 hypothetical protein M3Y96_01000000 [Aphelenchoides besseyi]
MTSRLLGYGKTAWSHKKKIIFFGGLAAYGVNWGLEWNREQQIRSEYARRAESIGRQNVTADYQPLKLLVFVDHSDPERMKNVNSFNKNVLPLLILAGLDVRVELAQNVDDLHRLSAGADVRNCAGICIVGSKRFAVPSVLNGLFVGNEARTALAIFDPADRDQVEKLCKKSMDIIHGVRQRQNVYSTEIQFKDEEPESDFRLADLSFGWFDYFRERQTKFWIFGSLADRMACTWYLVKHFPQPLRLQINSTVHCTGCRRCVTEAPQDHAEQRESLRWWQRWIGRREQPSDQRRREYANRLNSQCGQESTTELEAVDLMIRNLNQGLYGGLELQSVPSIESRWSTIWRVWSEWNKIESPENFFVSQPSAQTLDIRIDTEQIPVVVRESMSCKRLRKSKDEPTPAISRIRFKAGPKTILIY